jgi:RNA polymerase sigma factor for flagellar operon FliA
MPQTQTTSLHQPAPGENKHVGARPVEPTDVLAAQRATEEQLVRANLPLVHYVVSEIAARIPRYICRDDLLSAGMAGLAQAARSYSPDRGSSFVSFATTRIRGSVIDDLRARDWASRSVRAKARAIAETSDALASTLRRQPTLAELATAMGTTKQAMTELSNDVHRAVVVDLSSLLVDGDATEVVVSGLPGSDEVVLDRERRAYLVAAVHHLPARLRRVIVGYFVEERLMTELAAELGVTESRISQMRSEALRLLKDALNAQFDPELVPSSPSPAISQRRRAYHSEVASHHLHRDRFSAEAGALASLARIPATAVA